MTVGHDIPQVLLDVTPIAARPEGRTGLARVALSLGLALGDRDDLALRTCACGSLGASEEFRSVRKEFPSLRGLEPRRSAWETLCEERVRSAANRGLWGSLWRFASQVTNRLRNPLAGLDLGQFDLAHSTYARIPSVVRRHGLPTLITVHDVMPLRLPAASLPRGQVGITRRILGSIRRDDWVACVSEWTRADFLDATGHSPERTVVIPNGVDHEAFHPRVPLERREAILRSIGLATRPYFLTLSSLAPHKNLRFLLDAWKRSGASHGGATLVMAGGRTTDPVVALRALGIDTPPPGVIFTGFIGDDEFRALASGCQAFLFPSLYEGFGLPVLEAMACGAPVIASNRTSIPEVVGPAGNVLDPTDLDAWSDAIRSAAAAAPRIDADSASVSGAARFSWGKTAAAYVALYNWMLA